MKFAVVLLRPNDRRRYRLNASPRWIHVKVGVDRVICVRTKHYSVVVIYEDKVTHRSE